MVICSNSVVSPSLRRRCSGRPCQPLPGEPAGSAHPQPNADEPYAHRLRHHGRAHVLSLSARSTRHYGPPGRDGADWIRRARDSHRGCQRWDECWDPVFHVHAPARDELANPSWGAARWNHQSFPLVRGHERLVHPLPFLFFFTIFSFLSLWLPKSWTSKKNMS